MKALSGFVSTLTDIAKSGFQQYKKVTPDRVKLLDLLVIFLGYTAVVQLLYCFIVGSFPFNSFLSGFICCVGSMTLTSQSASQGDGCTQTRKTSRQTEGARVFSLWCLFCVCQLVCGCS